MRHATLFPAALLIICIVALSPLCTFVVQAQEVPAPLTPWQQWVLHDNEEQTCPPHHDNGKLRRCWYPSRLRLEVNAKGALFSQQTRVYAPAWVTLPGNGRHWPASVAADGQLLPVVERKGRPSVRLTPGSYRIEGTLAWDRMPEMLQVPASVGLIALRLNGREVEDTQPDPDGRLQLTGGGTSDSVEDRLTVSVFRLIEDDIPMRVTTRALLNISGQPREIRLAGLLPATGLVMAIDSPLPVRQADNSDLLVQARAGRWDLRVTSRLSQAVDQVATGNGDFGNEVWSFKAYNHLRMVTVSGAPTVEPSRTQMPDAWKSLPAYQLKPGGKLSFALIRRGNPDPPPDQLHLQRSWWLDFDGGGFTLHDRVSGSLSRTWHLAMNNPVALGRVTVDGNDRLITLQDERPGVQLRHGLLDLSADSRLPRHGAVLPAVGWDHDFQQVAGLLHLPPGWSLFAASGVETPSHAWLQRWTLLDLFLVLIMAISAAKLHSLRIGLLALATLALTFHEPGAPRLIWLHLLAVAAGLKYLPDGWLKKVVHLWGMGAVITLVVIVLPFMVQQIRTAIYPQLGPVSAGHYRFDQPRMVLDEELELAAEPMLADKAAPRKMKRMKKTAGSRISAPPASLAITANDPNALIQTGPGLPDWQWHQVPLQWSGPVDRNQTMRLWLVSPPVNLALGVVRVLLLLALMAMTLTPRGWRTWFPSAGKAAAVVLVLSTLLLLPAPSVRAQSTDPGFPPQPLLDELQRRLLAPPECMPHCADINRLELSATPDQLRLTLQTHALVDTVVPLPARRGGWSPARVLLGNAPAGSLARDNRGQLWMVVPAGVHTIKLIGPPGATDEVRIAFPMRPHHGSYAGVGWIARGIHPDGRVDAGITLSRITKDTPAGKRKPKTDIAPFFQVERTLHLGLEWQATTRIRRQTATGTAAALSIPLLKGAAVTTAGIHVQDGIAQVVLGPDEVEARFTSTLPRSTKIHLTAPREVPWNEVWLLDAAPMWRCTFSGLTVVHHQKADHTWQPQWRPWPGERVSIEIQRPAAVAGRTTTVDRVQLDLTPGRHLSQAALTLELRASKGGPHQVELPTQADLQSVAVNGKELPLRQDGHLVTVPLEPGRQTVDIGWQQPTDTLNRIKAPRVNVGSEAVNARVSVHMPDHRWILFTGGPTLGPAVLFWSYVIVALLIAAALGKTDLTPLGTPQWILLGLGLTQVPAVVAVLVAGWLLALGYRCRHDGPRHALAFNGMQLLLAALTLAALLGLYSAIERGLLGIPDMQIAGNHSTRFDLNWTQDRIDGTLPIPWVVSLPLWFYRLLMLGWALWLAFSLIDWLRWGWGCFSSQGFWKPLRWPQRKNRPSPAAGSAATESGLKKEATASQKGGDGQTQTAAPVAKDQEER